MLTIIGHVVLSVGIAGAKVMLTIIGYVFLSVGVAGVGFAKVMVPSTRISTLGLFASSMLVFTGGLGIGLCIFSPLHFTQYFGICLTISNCIHMINFELPFIWRECTVLVENIC